MTSAVTKPLALWTIVIMSALVCIIGSADAAVVIPCSIINPVVDLDASNFSSSNSTDAVLDNCIVPVLISIRGAANSIRVFARNSFLTGVVFFGSAQNVTVTLSRVELSNTFAPTLGSVLFLENVTNVTVDVWNSSIQQSQTNVSSLTHPGHVAVGFLGNVTEFISISVRNSTIALNSTSASEQVNTSAALVGFSPGTFGTQILNVTLSLEGTVLQYVGFDSSSVIGVTEGSGCTSGSGGGCNASLACIALTAIGTNLNATGRFRSSSASNATYLLSARFISDATISTLNSTWSLVALTNALTIHGLAFSCWTSVVDVPAALVPFARYMNDIHVVMVDSTVSAEAAVSSSSSSTAQQSDSSWSSVHNLRMEVVSSHISWCGARAGGWSWWWGSSGRIVAGSRWSVVVNQSAFVLLASDANESGAFAIAAPIVFPRVSMTDATLVLESVTVLSLLPPVSSGGRQVREALVSLADNTTNVALTVIGVSFSGSVAVMRRWDDAEAGTGAALVNTSWDVSNSQFFLDIDPLIPGGNATASSSGLLNVSLRGCSIVALRNATASALVVDTANATLSVSNVWLLNVTVNASASTTCGCVRFGESDQVEIHLQHVTVFASAYLVTFVAREFPDNRQWLGVAASLLLSVADSVLWLLGPAAALMPPNRGDPTLVATILVTRTTITTTAAAEPVFLARALNYVANPANGTATSIGVQLQDAEIITCAALFSLQTRNASGSVSVNITAQRSNLTVAGSCVDPFHDGIIDIDAAAGVLPVLSPLSSPSSVAVWVYWTASRLLWPESTAGIVTVRNGASVLPPVLRVHIFVAGRSLINSSCSSGSDPKSSCCASLVAVVNGTSNLLDGVVEVQQSSTVWGQSVIAFQNARVLWNAHNVSSTLFLLNSSRANVSSIFVLINSSLLASSTSSGPSGAVAVTARLEDALLATDFVLALRRNSSVLIPLSLTGVLSPTSGSVPQITGGQPCLFFVDEQGGSVDLLSVTHVAYTILSTMLDGRAAIVCVANETGMTRSDGDATELVGKWAIDSVQLRTFAVQRQQLLLFARTSGVTMSASSALQFQVNCSTTTVNAVRWVAPRCGEGLVAPAQCTVDGIGCERTDSLSQSLSGSWTLRQSPSTTHSRNELRKSPTTSISLPSSSDDGTASWTLSSGSVTAEATSATETASGRSTTPTTAAIVFSSTLSLSTTHSATASISLSSTGRTAQATNSFAVTHSPSYSISSVTFAPANSSQAQTVATSLVFVVSFASGYSTSSLSLALAATFHLTTLPLVTLLKSNIVVLANGSFAGNVSYTATFPTDAIRNTVLVELTNSTSPAVAAFRNTLLSATPVPEIVPASVPSGGEGLSGTALLLVQVLVPIGGALIIAAIVFALITRSGRGDASRRLTVADLPVCEESLKEELVPAATDNMRPSAVPGQSGGKRRDGWEANDAFTAAAGEGDAHEFGRAVEMQPIVLHMDDGSQIVIAQEDDEGFYDTEGYYHYYTDDDGSAEPMVAPAAESDEGTVTRSSTADYDPQRF